MATKLGVYQHVARLVGQPRFATLTDETELRRLLDDAYDKAVDFCLGKAAWRFATAERFFTVTGASTLPGYTNVHETFDDTLRIVSVFVSNASTPRTSDRPVDVRIVDDVIHSNTASGIWGRVTRTLGRNEALWTERFATVVATYLAFQTTQRITSLSGRTDDLYGLFQRTLLDAAERDAGPEDPLFIPCISGALMASARYILSQGAWRFALDTATLSSVAGATAPGFNFRFTAPSDMVRLHSVFVTDSSGRERPVAFREDGSVISANVNEISIRYISKAVLASSLVWPDQFLRTVEAHLGIDRGDFPQRQTTDGSVVERPAVWPDYLTRALETEGVRPDPWFRSQIDGTFTEGARYVLSQGAWRFALQTDTLSAVGSTGTAPGFDFRFTAPSDIVRLHSVFVSDSRGRECPIDFREDGSVISANVNEISIRYISDAVLASSLTWPDQFLRTVGAHLGIDRGDFPQRQTTDGSVVERPAVWPDYLARALETEGVRADPWFRFQVDGTFAEGARRLLWEQDWRWATKTVQLVGTENALADLPYRFEKPADWASTVEILDLHSNQVEYREEDQYLYSEVEEVYVRYLRNDLTPTSWPQYFYNALLAHLTYVEAMGTAGTAGAVVNARLMAYDSALRKAKQDDDNRERARVNRTSKFTRARYGGYRSREDGGLY